MFLAVFIWPDGWPLAYPAANGKQHKLACFVLAALKPGVCQSLASAPAAGPRTELRGTGDAVAVTSHAKSTAC